MKNSITIISPNMMKLFLECPRKFYFKYIEQIPSPILDKNFETGKNLHALASYYLKGQTIDKFEPTLTNREKEYWDKLKNNPYFTNEITGIEKNITCKIGDYLIGGRIDAIVKNSANEYFILDYKTGGTEANMDYDPQTMVYLLMYSELYKDYKTLTFVYLDLKNNKEIKTEFSEKLKTEYHERITNICNGIHKFSLKQSIKPEGCQCEYIGVCEYI